MSSLPTSDVFSHAMALPDDERIRLAGLLLSSVKPPGAFSMDDPGFEEEIARRQQSLRDGTAKTYSAEETIAAMRAAIAQSRPS